MRSKIRPLVLLTLPATMLFSASVAPPSAAEVYEAIRHGETPRMESWLANGWKVNSADERGNTPLIHAAAVGNAGTVRMLLDAGADVKMANNLGVTALIVGATDLAKARMLVESGADVNAVAGTGRTPLIVAAFVPGNDATVKRLLDRGASFKAVDKMGMNALIASANAGNSGAMKMLVERGADVNYLALPGGSALHFAASNRDVAMMRYLLSKGAKVDARMNFAMPMRHGKIALDHITPLMLTASYGPVEAVRMMLDAGADVNSKDVRGMTPLMFAVSSEHQDPAIMKLLQARGARMDERSAAGETALDWAKKFNRRAVVTMLGGKPARISSEGPLPEGAGDRDNTPTGEAIGQAMKILETSQVEFFRQSGCAACHHGITTAMAASQARTHGLAINHVTAAEFQKLAMGQARGLAPAMVQMIDAPGAADTTMYTLLGLEAAGVEPDSATDAMAVNLLRHYSAARGWWTGGIARAPIADGKLSRTAVSLKVLNRYLPPAMAGEYRILMAQIRASLAKEPVVTNDDAAMKVLALHYAGAPAADVKAAVRVLEARQQANGGWGGHREMAPDAFATGVALFALNTVAGAQPPSPAAKCAVVWLKRHQQGDGTWHVASRAPKFQPYFESGFPYGRDQWISNAATGWATAALAGSMR